MTKFSRQKGFTLIELMIVIAIIAVLATLGVTNFSAAVRRARDGVRKSDISAIAQALVLYRSDEGSYPDNTGVLATTYIREIPVDPLKTASGGSTEYSYWTNGRKFTVCTKLEMASGNFNTDDSVEVSGRCSATSSCTAGENGSGGTANGGGKGCCQCVFSP